MQNTRGYGLKDEGALPTNAGKKWIKVGDTETPNAVVRVLQRSDGNRW